MIALGKPELLERISFILLAIRKLYLEKFKKNNPSVTINEFHESLRELGVSLSIEETEKLFRRLDADLSGEIDYIDWTQIVRLEDL
jgi:hypothetical protein